MKRLVATSLLALAAAGCTSQLTQAGAQVRPVQPEGLSRCELLAPVEGLGANGPSTAENELAATNDVRNRVAKLGGNAYAIRQRAVSTWRTVVQADAYRCPSWEPVRGLAPR